MERAGVPVPSSSQNYSNNNKAINFDQNYQFAATTSNIRPRVYFNSMRPSDIPYNPVGQSFPSQIRTLFNTVPQLHQHQNLQHVAAERPNIHQLPMQPNTYLRDKSHQRNQELLFNNNNHLNQTNSDERFQQIPQQLQMQQMNQTQTGLVPQGVHLGPSQALLDSSHQIQLANSSAWIDTVFERFLLMKQMYLPEVVEIYKKANEKKRLATDLETVTRYEKIRDNAKKIAIFLEMSKSDLMRHGEAKAYQAMKSCKTYINSFMQLQQPIIPLSSQSRTEQNVTQSYGTPTSSQGADDSSTSNMYNPSVGVSHGNSLSIPHHHKLNPLNSSSSGLLDSTHQVQLANSSAWIDTVYEQFLLMKQTYLPEVVKVYKKATEKKHVATDLETVARYEKIISHAKQILTFMKISKSDLSRHGEVKAYQAMKSFKSYIDSLTQLLQQPMPSSSQSRTEQNVNLSQFYDSSTSSQNADDSSIMNSRMYPSVQVSQGNYNLIQNSINTHMDQETSTQNLKKPVQQKNDVTRFKHVMGFNRKKSFLVPSSSSPCNVVAPQNSLVSIEMNDLSSKKPVDSKDSLLSSEESNKIPNTSAAAAAAPPLEENKEINQNQDLQGPLQFSRLVQVVKSISSKNLNGFLRDIDAVTSATDRIGVLDWESSKVIVKDLTNDIRSYEDGNFGLAFGTGMMKCRLNTIASSTETEFCESGGMKRQKKAPDDKLLEEIKEINRKLIEVVVDVMNVKDVDKTGFDEGKLIRCSYSPIGLLRKTRMANTSPHMFPHLILQLVVTADYPRSSPTVMETLPPGCSEVEEGKDMWMKAKSNFTLLLRKFSEPISLVDMAKTWDICAREVYREFAERDGGGHFISRYGKWESCVAAV